MKTLVTCITIILVTAPIMGHSQVPLVSKWEKVGPVNFTALVHQSPNRIVATTDHGYLYITDDDGTTWQRQEISDTVDINGIAYGDSLHGALIASGNLMLSSDGGMTWQGLSTPANGNLVMVGAVGADTLIVGAPTFIGDTLRGKIFRSTDAGMNWDTVFTSDSAIEYWQAPMKIVFFFGSGYAIGQNFYAKTTDAGAHWAAQYLNGEIRDIDFFNSNTGGIASTSGYYVTTDGGSNWAFTPVFHDERDDSYMALKFFGPKSFFMFGTPNAYYYTSNDLGATVSLAEMRQASSISNVIRTQNGTWIAVGGGIGPDGLPYGGGGIILRGTFSESMTTPEWTVLAECPFSSGVSLHATNGAMLDCVAGSYPLISTDSGIFWHITDLHSPDYGAMHFSAPDTGYLYYIGSDPSVYGGVNLITADSGQSWKPVNLSPAYVYGATFGSSDTGYAFSGSLVRTTDGGAQWQPDSIQFSSECPYPGYKVYRSTMANIASPDGLDAFVTARVIDTLVKQTGQGYYVDEKYHFAVYKTSDGGASWPELGNVPTLQTTQGIYFRNASLGFLLADSGRIYRTSDGGNNWSMEQIAPFRYSFNSINFLNDCVGFLTLDSAAVLATTDAGLTWAWLTVPTNREEIADAQIQFIMGKDTVQNQSGVSTQGVFFPDSTTVLISFVRTLININIPPEDTVINGDTIIEFTPVDEGEHVYDYGFYRGKLNIPVPSSVEQSPLVLQNNLEISIYPNPAQDETVVRISAPDDAVADIHVLDVLGRRVIDSRAKTNSDFSLDLNALPSGIYSLRCIAGSTTINRSFTIEK